MNTPAAPAPAPSAPPIKNGTKIRGTLTIVDAEAHDYEFRAQRSTGESVQQVVAKSGAAKLYRTTGRRPQMVAHLTTAADSSDPLDDLYTQLDKIAAKCKPAPAAGCAAPRAGGRSGKKRNAADQRVLLHEEQARVVLSRTERRVDMQLSIDLARTPDYQNELIRLMQRVSQCLLINQPFLAPPRS